MQAAVDAGPIGRSKALDDSLARAHQLAVAQGHAAVTLEHLLFSLQDDPDGKAILASSGVNRDGLAADVSAFVGRLSETAPLATGGSPQPGADLLRILQLAGMAARQSSRRQVDGAIVLAAIIGDGTSPAAGMLKAQGLTFDATIQALALHGNRQAQVAAPPVRTPLPAPETPGARIARVPDAPSADSMLADVRARVKQAEPVTLPIKVPAPNPTQAKAKPAVASEDLPVAEAPVREAPVEAAPLLPEPSKVVEKQPQPVEPAPAHVAKETKSAPALAELRRSQPTASIPAPPALAPTAAQAPQPQAVQPPPAAVGLSTLPSAMPGGRPPLPPAAARPTLVQQTAPAPPPLAAPPQAALQAIPVAAPQPHNPLPQPPPLAHAPSPMPVAATTPMAQLVPAAAPMPQQPMAPVKPVDVVAAAAGLPAVMRMGTPVLVEVKIPRDQIDVPRRRGAQMLGPQGDPPVYRIVSVRLGTGGVSGLAIEPRSPETIWIGMGRDVDATDFVWQFVVTPTRAGRFAVSLAVAGRTVSPYGVAGDGTPVSETFAVIVKRQSGQRMKRVLGGLTMFAIGAATAVFAGGPIMAAAKTMIAKLIK